MSAWYVGRFAALPIAAIVAFMLGLQYKQSLAFAQRTRPADGVAPPEAICGPRCVQFVLGRFGSRENLTDLIAEIQPSGIGEGSSMDALQRAIENRGLYTAAIRVGPKIRIHWPDPVLVHLKEGNHGLGHYIVQLPSANARDVPVFVGAGSVQTVARSSLARRRSGNVLLVSAKPIERWNDALVVASGAWLWTLVPTCVLVILVWAFCTRLVKKE